jgi:hypothetical protein
MPFIPIPNTVKVICRYGSGDHFWSNVLHFTREEFTYEDMQAMAVALGSGFFQELKEPLPASVSILGVTIYDMRTETSPKLVHDYSPAITGGQTDEPPVSLVAAAVISFYGAGRGQANQGRAYIGGLPEADADEGRVQSGQYEVVRAAFATLVTDPPTGWTWVVASTQFNKLPRQVGVTTPVVSVVGRSNIWARQGRRIKRP